MAQLATWMVYSVVMFTFATLAFGRMCTVLQSETKTVLLTSEDICTQSYQARCSFLSSRQCTFYEKVPCKRGTNVTQTFYKIVMRCCPGYYMKDDMTCAENKSVHTDETYWDDFDLPHGAYAGVACAGLFLICVVIIVVIHARGGRCKSKKAQRPPEQKVELQKMITA